MARLYAYVNSDSAKNQKTLGGSEMIEVNINWGSAGNSQKAGRICVVWDKGTDKPKVYLQDFTEDK